MLVPWCELFARVMTTTAKRAQGSIDTPGVANSCIAHSPKPKDADLDNVNFSFAMNTANAIAIIGLIKIALIGVAIRI